MARAWVGCALLAISGVAQGAIFSERAAELGLDFVHFNGMSGEFYFPEMMGPGGALFDYDNDGDLDVYLVQGHMLGPGKALSDALLPPRSGQPLSDRLFRNDLVIRPDGTPVLHFTDVTEASGIRASGYGMGVSTGDFDNDGWLDLYVTNFGANQLWRNNGDGSFTEVTPQAGVDAPRWSVGAAFLDFDRDGWLDLYVGNYVNFSFSHHITCRSNSSAQDYCSPLAYNGLPDRLFRNRGDGRFEDVSARSHIVRDFGGALGVVVGDYNGDGWLDIYVANDGVANQLWINRQDGTFDNEALLAGVAVNMEGTAEASMGVDAADYDGDGDEDLFMTHLLGETNTLYVNNGQAWFEDRSLATGLAAPSMAYTSFGTGWFDYDNDGWLDLFIANGEVKTIPAQAQAGDPYPLHQTNQLFRNLGNGRFEEVTAQAGAALRLSEVSRGAAFGDVDNDGDTDILLLNNNGPVRLLLNQVGGHRHWLGLRVLDRAGRDALGVRVEVLSPAGGRLWRRVRTNGSYASANDPRVLAGLGETGRVDAVRVHWLDGRAEQWKGLGVDRYITLRQGEGEPVLTKAAGGKRPAQP
jgi:hypothetical protein